MKICQICQKKVPSNYLESHQWFHLKKLMDKNKISDGEVHRIMSGLQKSIFAKNGIFA